MTEYARDTFTRTLASGWGTAEVGGAWTEALTQCTSLVVTNDRARISFAGHQLPGSAYERLASATPALDVIAAGNFNTPATWFTSPGLWTGTFVTLWLRVSGTVGSPTGYYCTFQCQPDNIVRIRMGYAVAGVQTELYSFDYPADAAIQNKFWQMEAEAVGAPTKLRCRAWRTDLPVPAANVGWHLVADETGPQVAGVLAVSIVRGDPPTDNGQVCNLFDYYATDPPLPNFTWTTANLQANVNAASSAGDFTAYSWSWGDGTAAGAGINPSHVYAAAGTYKVTLTATTRWLAKYVAAYYVTVAAAPPAPPDMVPIVLIDGVNVCDDVYSLTWSLGRAHWTEGFGGQTCSINLRGIYPAAQGMSVTISSPAETGGKPLWVGVVDQVTEVNEIDDGRDNTMLIAMDMASQLARYHILGATILPIKPLPGRLADLRPMSSVIYRYRYPNAVAAGRWVNLEKKSQSVDKLRDRTYLDMISDALTACLAFGYTARDGAIAYAPWEAPPSLPSTPSINLNAGIDCASRVTLDRNSLEGMLNRWTVGDGTEVDTMRRDSIEAYGERAYTVGSDVLLVDHDFPIMVPRFLPYMVDAFADPLRAATVEVPVIDWAQKAIYAEPLDFATWNSRLYSITGIAHNVSVGNGWRTTLSLDRNPWEIDGRTPP